MQRDRELVAGFLRVEEAEMLSELLASAGIEAWVEGAIASVLGPLLPGAGGGAKLLVRTPDAARARELIASSGVFRGEDGATAEIPEQEWAAPSSSGAAPDEAPGKAGRKTFLLYPLVVAAAIVAATVLQLLTTG